MRNVGCAVIVVVSALVAGAALADQRGKGVRVERGEMETNQALAVIELVRYAESKQDPEAFLVAARMLAEVKGPVSTADLEGQLPTGVDLRESVEKSQDVLSPQGLLTKARGLAKDSAELKTKIDEAERQVKGADLTEFYDPYLGCWHGYCRGYFGCWRYCY